jgi:tetratricopeptide (TPR) repeat protein
MDLVRGVPITRYCDEHHLTPRQRLELFIPVCQAIQHAHQKGIIHRDLKPSNVLVALYDGKPVPKVIDFGVAKAAGQTLTDKTLVTGFGNIVGTLEYMSPEQAEFNQLDIDTRCDIYSLGVLLYELLTGSPPFSRKDLEPAGMLEMLRVIREEEPSKPSTKLSTAEGLPTLAANRGTEPAKLTKLVRGELDWIVMKALEKDRNRRYETANGFAMDVQRYLADEPVLACPPSLGYRLRKFLRRNKGPVLATALILTLLVGGVVGTTIGLVRSLAAEKLAQANFAKARQAVNEWFTQVSQTTLFDAPGLQPVRAQLLESARKYYEEFLEQQRDDPELQGEMAAAWFRLAVVYHLNDRNNDAVTAASRGVEIAQRLIRERPGDPALARQLAGTAWGFRPNETAPPADITHALAVLQQQAKLWEELVQQHRSVPELRADLGVIYHYMADAQGVAGQGNQAVATNRKSCKLLEDLSREHPTRPEYRVFLASAYGTLFYQLGLLGRSQEAEEARQRADTLKVQVGSEFPQVAHYRMLRAEGLARSGSRLAKSGQSEEAEKAYRQSIEILEKLVADYPDALDHWKDLMQGRINLAELLNDTARANDAEAVGHDLMEDVEKLLVRLPKSNIPKPQLLTQSLRLVVMLSQRGRHQEASILGTYVFQLEEILATDSPDTLDSSQALAYPYWEFGNSLLADGQLPEAIGAFRKSMGHFEKLAAGSPQAAQARIMIAHNNGALGHTLRRTGQVQEAESTLRQSIGGLKEEAALVAVSAVDRWRLQSSYADLIELLKNSGRTQEAEKVCRDAIASAEKLCAVNPSEPELRLDLARAWESLARFLNDSNRPADVDNARALTIAIWEKLCADFPDRPNYLSDFAVCLHNIPSPHEEPDDCVKRLERCLALQQATLKIKPENRDYRIHLGNHYLALGYALTRKGDHAKAKEAFDQAIEIKEKLGSPADERANVFRQRGEAYMQLGEKDQADADFRKAEELLGSKEKND